MTHRGVLLCLEGPLQAWGTQSRFGYRDTDCEPSKSGVLGMVGAAMGMRRDDTETLRRLASLTMGVRVDREGKILRDYHTVGDEKPGRESHLVYGAKATVVTERFYLMDACFVVGLSGEDHALIDQIAMAVRAPFWPVFLGRKSCVPSRSVFLAGPTDGDAETLVRQTAWQGASAEPPARLRCVFEDPVGKPRADAPRSFKLYARAFDTRFVREEWLSLSDIPGDKHVLDSSVA